MPSVYSEFKFDQFVGGFNTDVDAEVLPKHFIAAGQNIEYNKAILSKRDGRQTYNAFAFTGTLYGLFVFQLSSGTSYLMAITTSHLYYFTGSTWSDITPVAHNLTGSVSTPPQFIAANDICYITNDADPIIQWTGSGNATYITGNGAPDFCLSIQTFANYLFAIRPTVSGTGHGWRVMWTDKNADGTPNAAVWNSGQAGLVDLVDTAEQVLSATVTSRWMSVYKTSTIYNVLFVGPPVFFDFTRLDQPGTIAPRTIVEIPMLGYFALGKDDVYIFDGNQSRPIGKPIRQDLFMKLNYTDAYAPFAWVRPDLGRVYLHVPFTTATPDNVYTYSYLEGQWMPEGPYPATAGLYSVYSQNLLINQLIGNISAQTQTFDDMTRLNQRVPLETDGTNIYSLQAVANDFVTPTTLAINSSFTTASVALATDKNTGTDVPCTVYGIKLLANSRVGTVSLTVGASIGNDQYTTYGPFLVSATSAMQTIVPCECYGTRFQVTAANSNVNETFEIKQLSLLFRPYAGGRV